MNFVRIFTAFAVGLSSLGLILPEPILNAAPPAPTPSPTPSPVQPPAKSISDVKLDAAGYLHGMVVDLQGTPIANARVVVAQGKQDLGEVRTDSMGRFSAGPLGRGDYLMKSGGQSRAVRAWTPKMAPPAAKQVALLVTGDELIRGQMPLEDFFASDAFIITGLVAALIAIPIAVHNSGSKTPASP
jgi:hypothetical protein